MAVDRHHLWEEEEEIEICPLLLLQHHRACISQASPSRLQAPTCKKIIAGCHREVLIVCSNNIKCLRPLLNLDLKEFSANEFFNSARASLVDHTIMKGSLVVAAAAKNATASISFFFFGTCVKM